MGKLQSEDAGARRAAAEAAGRVGPAAVFELAALLEADRPEVRKCAEQALFRIVHHASRPGASRAREQVARAALQLLSERPSGLQREALFRIFSLTARSTSGDRRLRKLLLDPEFDGDTYRALARIDHPGAARLLIDRLPDPRAIRALGDQAGESAVRPLLTVASESDPEAAREARHALARMGAASVRPLLEAAWRQADDGSVDDLLLLAEHLLDRGDRITPREIYTGLLASNDALVRSAVASGLGRCAGPGDLGLLVRLLDDSADVRGAAIRSLAGLEGRSVERRLESLCRSSSPSERSAGLRALALRRSGRPGPWIRALLGDPDASVRNTAIRLASQRNDPELIEPLLRLAGDRSGEERTAALGAVLAQLRGTPEAPGAAMTLEQVEVLDEDHALGEEQLAARLSVATHRLGTDPEQAQLQLERVLFESSSKSRRSRALQLLKRSGVDVSQYPLRTGFLLDWQLLGPLGPATRENFHELPFEPAPDLNAEVSGKHAALRWSPYHSEQTEGQVPLDEIFGGEEQATALAYCEFIAPVGDGLLKIGSDDGVAVWLNGELVHANLVFRGLTTDQDQVEVRFREGLNRLLVKVSQGGGGWAFCVRLADASGRPIDRTLLRE